ncbi:CotH kinase family protein [Bacillus sp. FJAT-50079]|uniref:CotH kinase family protein n=1 Tax=Bacillus sp. FJAT-50079 TaxID=2833577 RepID=UPI001BC93205|nr:CotH kinase family protein [Bacillus sp. FJAT-50079]MBS4209521.1 CotH kinase family protein [Bacillus sp. FJAT-50079]
MSKSKDRKWGIVTSLVIVLMLVFWGTTTRAIAEEKHTDDPIFKKGKISNVNIEIDEADLQDMLDNPMEEEYKEGTVTYNGITIGYTGVRVKGNSSLMSVASSDSNRYSFKLEFNKYIDQNLEGYTKINLNNNFADPSYMREYLTYDLLKAMGLETPNYGYVNVSINGELYGLYLAVENIEEPYLERNFGNSTGNLYKADTGASLTWENGMSIEQTGLTMKSGRANNTKLLEFIKALNDKKEVESYFDVDKYLRYLAVSTVTASMDSYQGMMSHNYYLYEQNGKFTFLAWDQNMSIGGMMGQDVDGQKEMLIDEPTVGAVKNHPLVDYVLSNNEYKEQYHQYVQQTVDLLKDIESQVDQLKSLIGDDVKKDPTAFYSYDEFIANTGDQLIDGKPGIVGFMKERLTHVQKQLDGEIPSYVNGEGISGGMQGMDNRGMREGMQGMGNGEMPEGFPGMGNGEMPEGFPGMGNGEMPEGFPGMGNGEMPEGFPNMNNGEMPEGMPAMGNGGMPNMGRGGMPWGMNGNQGANHQDQLKELITVAALLVLLFGSLLFVNRFKRYRGYKRSGK